MINPVIDNVRRSLGRTAQSPLSPRPAIYKPLQAENTETEIQQFLEEVRKLSGVGQRISPGGVAEAMKAIVSENKIRKATLWTTPFIAQLGIEEVLNTLGVEIMPPTADKNTLALCDLGITDADFLLPETGTVVLQSSAEKPRTVSLLPRIHLAIVRPDMLRPDMHQVFAEAKNSNYLVFITGPSRTADIELTVTLGVHGPKQLFAWMLENIEP